MSDIAIMLTEQLFGRDIVGIIWNLVILFQICLWCELLINCCHCHINNVHTYCNERKSEDKYIYIILAKKAWCVSCCARDLVVAWCLFLKLYATVEKHGIRDVVLLWCKRVMPETPVLVKKT